MRAEGSLCHGSSAGKVRVGVTQRVSGGAAGGGGARRDRAVPRDSYDPAMDIGVCVASDISDIDYAVLAEELGYSHVWVADSHMIWSDCYAVLALVAERTSRVKIDELRP